MILTARINDDRTFKLIKWDNYDFQSNLRLLLQGIDLLDIKTAFCDIHKIEIFKDDNLIGTYTSFDTFSNISYLGQMYVEGEKIFADAMSVTLTKANIVEQVQRLNDQINPIIDFDVMSLEEYKNYRLEEVSDACTASIYTGDQVTLSDGSVETFAFTDKDQADLQSLSSIAMLNPQIELTWHSDGNPCKFYSAIDIILIYQTLNMKLFRETTICNAINMLIRNAESKDEVDMYYWGCTLPENDQVRVDALINKMSSIVANIMTQFIPAAPQEQITPQVDPEGGESNDDSDNNPVNNDPVNDNPTNNDNDDPNDDPYIDDPVDDDSDELPDDPGIEPGDEE